MELPWFVWDAFQQHTTTKKSDGDAHKWNTGCVMGGEHKVDLLSTKNQTPTHVHSSQGAAVVTQILWWAVVCHTVQQQAQQRAASHSLSCASFLTWSNHTIWKHWHRKLFTDKAEHDSGGQSQYPCSQDCRGVKCDEFVVIWIWRLVRLLRQLPYNQGTIRWSVGTNN